MRKLLVEIIQNLEVDKLDRRSCLEGIYYIDYLIEMEGDIKKKVAYF